MKTCPLFTLVLLVHLWSVSTMESEVYSSVAHLEDLVETEFLLTNTLVNYIRAEEKKLHYLKRFVEISRNRYKKASEDAEAYVANPLNAYILIKQLTIDWKEIEILITTDDTADFVSNVTKIKKNMRFPIEEDLEGAAVGLARLQYIYGLDTPSMARGELNGVKYSSELSASDCFEIGRQLYNNNYFNYTWLWMMEAITRLDKELDTNVRRSEILDYLAFSIYKLGNTALALDLTNSLLEIEPTHQRAQANKIYYEFELQNMTENNNVNVVEEPDLFQQLCRGEVSPPIEETSKLKCYYMSKNHHFLMLARIKVEEVHHKPDIIIFHDIISDSEIATIKRIVRPQLKRSRVFDLETQTNQTVHDRVSKTKFIKQDEDKYIADLTRRISDMTGLTMATAEPLSVVNYGIGGYFNTHFDFINTDKIHQPLELGDRIATVLFYMTDVERSGATVFPAINLTIWPRKGTALFWYNLHPSGDGDKMTLHAGCPVLIGSKWISTKWIREQGQEFLRPCTLERPNEDLII